MPTFDDIDIEALRKETDPPLDLCMMAVAKQSFLNPSPEGWEYLPDDRCFARWISEDVWYFYGDRRGYPEPVTFCGCEIDGRYDHWEDRSFYRIFLPEDCAAPEVQPLLALLQALK